MTLTTAAKNWALSGLSSRADAADKIAAFIRSRGGDPTSFETAAARARLAIRMPPDTPAAVDRAMSVVVELEWGDIILLANCLGPNAVRDRPTVRRETSEAAVDAVCRAMGVDSGAFTDERLDRAVDALMPFILGERK